MVLISVGVCLPLDFGHHLVSATVASEEDGAVTVAPDDVTEQATDPPTTDTADVVTDGAAAEDDLGWRWCVVGLHNYVNGA